MAYRLVAAALSTVIMPAWIVGTSPLLLIAVFSIFTTHTTDFFAPTIIVAIASLSTAAIYRYRIELSLSFLACSGLVRTYYKGYHEGSVSFTAVSDESTKELLAQHSAAGESAADLAISEEDVTIYVASNCSATSYPVAVRRDRISSTIIVLPRNVYCPSDFFRFLIYHELEHAQSMRRMEQVHHYTRQALLLLGIPLLILASWDNLLGSLLYLASVGVIEMLRRYHSIEEEEEVDVDFRAIMRLYNHIVQDERADRVARIIRMILGFWKEELQYGVPEAGRFRELMGRILSFQTCLLYIDIFSNPDYKGATLQRAWNVVDLAPYQFLHYDRTRMVNIALNALTGLSTVFLICSVRIQFGWIAVAISVLYLLLNIAKLINVVKLHAQLTINMNMMGLR